MICAPFSGLAIAGWQTDCLGSAAAPWAMGLLLCSAILSLWLARRSGRATGWITAALFIAASSLIALATERPTLRRNLGPLAAGGTVYVLADRSESFWRDEPLALASLETLARRLDDFLAALPPQEAGLWRGELQGFGITLRAEGSPTALEHLPATLRAWRVTAPEPQSDIGQALERATHALQGREGRRILVLLSDGQATQAVDPASIGALRAAGIDVHFLARGASRPASGLIAADLGPDHDSGSEAILRGTVLGGGEIALRQGEGAAPPVPVADTQLPRAMRLITTFHERGLQGVELALKTETALQKRRLFTLVRGPARLLVFGQAPWAEHLPPERWRVERAPPQSPPDLTPFDAVVIDGLAPTAFAPGFAETLLSKADGRGLLLINGGLRGAVSDKQLISDWNETALSPILPVDSDPRLLRLESPPRDIVIMVDTSGSMSGRRLSSARSVIEAVLAQLRPQDSITILPFSDGAQARFPQTRATRQGLEAARRFTRALSAGGGTMPEETIRESARFVSNYCAFFFISDGGFAAPKTAPQCFTTAISVSNRRMPIDVSSWGEELTIGEGGDGANLKLRYFEPEGREEFFREGQFQPKSTGEDRSFAPQIPVGGIAITFPRIDAHIETIHASAPPDPLFAWRRDAARPGVATAVFTGAMTEAWGRTGIAATEAMLSRLIAWPDQDKYLLRVTENGAGLELNVIEIKDKGGPIAAALLRNDGTANGISLAYDERMGAYRGMLPPLPSDLRGLLQLEQGGGVQRIPVFLPADAVGGGIGQSEAISLGIDREFFSLLQLAAGADDLDRSGIALYRDQTITIQLDVFPYLLALAFLLLAGAIWSRELRVRE